MKNYFFCLLFVSHILGLEICPELSAHPSSTSSYIQMVHGISIRRECPPSTIYYPELCRCDHIAKSNVGGTIQITQTGPNINTQPYNTVQSPGQQNRIAIIVKPKQQNDVSVRKKTMWVPVARNPKPVISSNDNLNNNGGTVVTNGNAKQRHDDAHQALLDILNGGKANKPSIPLGTNVGLPFSHMVGSRNYMMQTIPTTPSSIFIRTLLPTTPRPIEIRVRPGAGKGTRIDATKPTMTLTNYVRPYSLTRQETFVQQPPEPKTYSIGIQEPRAILEQINVQDPITPQPTIQSKTAYYGRRPHESIQNQNKPQTYEWKTIQNEKTPEVLRKQQKQIPSYDRGTSYVLRTQTDQRTKAELLQPLSPELPSQQITISGGTKSYDGYSRNKNQNLEDILRNIVIKVTPSPIIDAVQTTARNRRYREYGEYRSRYRIQQQEPQTTPQPILYEQTTQVKERKHYRQYGEYHSRYRIQQQDPPTTPPPIVYEQTTQVKERRHYRQYGEYHSRYRIQQQEPLTTPPPIIYEQTTKRQERQRQQQYVEYQSGYSIQQQEPLTTPPPIIYEQTTKRQERQRQQQYVEYQSGYSIQQQEPLTTPPPIIYEQTTKRQERQPQQHYVEYQSGYRIQQQEPLTTPPPIIYEQTTKRQERQPQQQYVEYQSGYRIQQQEPLTTPSPLIYEQTTRVQELRRNRQYGEYQSLFRIQQQEPTTTPPIIYEQTTQRQQRKRNRQYGDNQLGYRIQQQEPTTTPQPVVYEQTTQRQQRDRYREYGEYQSGYRIQQQVPQTTPPPLIFDPTTPVQQLKRNRQYGEYQSQYALQQQEQTTQQPIPYEQTTTMPEPKRQQQYGEYQSGYHIQQQEPQPTAPPLVFDPTTPVQELKRNRQYDEYQSQYGIQQQEPQTTQPPMIYEQITQRQQRKRNRQIGAYNSQMRIQQQEPQPTAPPLIFDQTTRVQELKVNRQYGEYQSQYAIKAQEPTTTPQPILYEQATKLPEPKRQQQYGEYQSGYRIQQQEPQPTAPPLVFDPTTPVQELKRNRQYGEYQSQYGIRQQEPETTQPPIVNEQITQQQQRNRQYGEYNSQYRIQQQETQPTAPPLVFDPTTPVQQLKRNRQYGEYQSQYVIQQQEPQSTQPPIVYEQITQRQQRKRNPQYGEYQSRYRLQQQEPSTTQTLMIYEQTTPVQELPRYRQHGEYQGQYQNQQQEQTTPPPLIYEQTTQRQQRRRVRQYGEYQSRYPKELQQPQTTLPSFIYEQATQGQEPERYQEYRYNFITTTTPAPSNSKKSTQRADNNQSGRLQLRQGQLQKISNGNANYEISQSTRELSVMQNSYQDMNLYTEIVPTDGYVNTNVNPRINPDTQIQHQTELINALPSGYTRHRLADQNQPIRNTGADQPSSSNNPTRISPQEQRPISQDQYNHISDPVQQSQSNIRQSSNDPEIDIRRQHRRRRIRPKGILPRYRHQQDLGQTDQTASDDRRLNTSRSLNSGPADTRQNANLENDPIVRVQTDYGPSQNQIPLNSYGQSNVETSQNVANNPSFTEYGQYSPPSNNNENTQSQGNGGVNYAANQNFNPEPVYIQTTNVYEVATEPPPIRNAPYSQTNGQQPQPQVQYATNPDPVPDPNRYSQYQPETIIDQSNQPNQHRQNVQNVLEPVSISQPQTEPGTGLQSSGGEYGSNRDLPIGSQGQSERSINRFRIGIRPNTDGNSPGTIVSHSDGYAVSVSGRDSSLQVLAKQEQKPLRQQSQFQRGPTQQQSQPYGSSNIFEVSQSKPLKEQRQAGAVNQNSNTFRILRDSYVPRVISVKEPNVVQAPEQRSYRQQSLTNHQIHGNAPQNQNAIPKIIHIQTKRNNTDRFAFIQPQPSPSPRSTPQLSDYVRSSNPSSNTYTIQISHNAATENSKRFPAIDFSHDTSFRTGRITEVSNRQTNLNSNINIQDVQRPAIGTPRENNNRLHVNSYPSQMVVVNPTVNPVQTIQQAPVKQPIFGPSILVNPTAPPAPTPRSWTNNRINTGLPNPPRQGYQTYNSPTHRIQINPQAPVQRTIPSPKVQTVSRKVTIIQQNQGSNTNRRTPGNSGSYGRPMTIVVPKQVIRQTVQVVNPTQVSHHAAPLGPAPGPTQGPTQVPAQAHAPPHAGPPVWKPDPNVHWRTNVAQMEAADVPDMQAVSFINHLLAKQPGLSQMDRFFLQELIA